jgi:hypothetical protein
MDSNDDHHLRLLARPELGVTFTKIAAWLLTDYEKCVAGLASLKLASSVLLNRGILRFSIGLAHHLRSSNIDRSMSRWIVLEFSGVLVNRSSLWFFEERPAQWETPGFDSSDQGLLLHAAAMIHFPQTIQSRCVFVDSDMLALHNVDELMQMQELSAAADCGWPDTFNSVRAVGNAPTCT